MTLRQPAKRYQLSPQSLSRKRPQRHVKEDCRRAEWRFTTQSDALEPIWQVTARRAVTIPANERRFAEHLEGASCRVYRFMHKPHILSVASPVATYHYAERRLQADQVEWSLYPLSSASKTKKWDASPLSCGTCGQLNAHFSRAEPSFEALDFLIKWQRPQFKVPAP